MHGDLSTKQTSKTDSGSLPDSSQFTLTACIVAHSGLANRYLLQVLAETAGIRSVPLEEFIEDPGDPQSTVFIFDASSLKLPLGECMRRLQMGFSGARYLVIDRTKTIHQIAQLLLLGAHGYVSECKVAQELPEAARAVVDGRLWVTNAALQEYVSFTLPSNRTKAPKAHLPTHRETQILELVQHRFSNKEIAEMFEIQESTVKFHLTNIFGKLQVLNRRELSQAGSSSDVWERILEYCLHEQHARDRTFLIESRALNRVCPDRASAAMQ